MKTMSYRLLFFNLGITGIFSWRKFSINPYFDYLFGSNKIKYPILVVDMTDSMNSFTRYYKYDIQDANGFKFGANFRFNLDQGERFSIFLQSNADFIFTTINGLGYFEDRSQSGYSYESEKNSFSEKNFSFLWGFGLGFAFHLNPAPQHL